MKKGNFTELQNMILETLELGGSVVFDNRRFVMPSWDEWYQVTDTFWVTSPMDMNTFKTECNKLSDDEIEKNRIINTWFKERIAMEKLITGIAV